MGKSIKDTEKEAGTNIKQLLTERYCGKGLTQREIANLLGYDQGNLSRLMDKLGIPSRSYSETQSKYWMSGADTTKQLSNLVRGFNKGQQMSDKQKAKISRSNQGKHGLNFKVKPQPNRIEKVLQSILNRYLPGEWKFCGDGSAIIGGLCPDFINVNSKKLIIEVFGSYWHNPERRKLRFNQTVEGRIEAFKAFGFNTLILWDYEIKELPEAELVNRIKMLEAM